ncbi:MAG: hypothetical protein ABI120_18780 [Gemmatimonadaceae bacterium]
MHFSRKFIRDVTGVNARALWIALLMALLVNGGAATSVGAQKVLRPLDSVVVKETETMMLSKLGSITIGARGQVFVSDIGEGRVLQIAPTGLIVGQFGKRGNGPGEMMAPSSSAIIGDSLFVLDRKRISVFNISTRTFVRSFNVTVGSFAQIGSVGNQLIALDINFKAFTPVTLLSPGGVAIGREGALPAYVRENPKLAGVPGQYGFAVRGTDAWFTSSFSQSLFRWKRGATAIAEELKLPVVRRRGVVEDKYLQMLRDPSKAPELVYDFSFPQLLQFISPDIVALITLDPTLEKGVFFGTHYLTLVDVRTKRICPDILAPIPTDPMPRLGITGDTLVVLEQGSDRSGELVNSLRRFKIDPKQCAWKPL